MIRRIFLTALIGGVACAAPQTDEPLPKADTILDRYIEVTGGKAAYEKRKTAIETGTFEFKAQGLKGPVTRYAAEPAQEYSAIEIEGVGKMETGSSGGVAWEKSFIGAHIKSGEEKIQAMREATFNAPIKWRELYKKAETAGIETIDGEPCYKVLLTPVEGKSETMYFEKKSGLAVKTTMVAVTQMGEIPFEATVADYKSFGGVMVPTKMIQSAGGQQFTITIQDVKINEEIPPDRFEPPADVKALLNKPTPVPEKK